MQIILKRVKKNFMQRTLLDFILLKPTSRAVSVMVGVDIGSEGLGLRAIISINAFDDLPVITRWGMVASGAGSGLFKYV